MKKVLLLAFFLMLAVPALAQQGFIKHTVVKGETVTQIAKQYELTPTNIYSINPDAQNGLNVGMVLLIPKGKGVVIREVLDNSGVANEKKHVVAAKETVYGLAKLYNISEADLKKANPAIATEGLKIGMVLTIPAKIESDPFEQIKGEGNPKEAIYHLVVAKETKYSIAKQYGVTIADLEAKNPEIKNGLQIGFRLTIPQKNKPIPTKEIEQPTVIIKNPIKPGAVSYEVQPKETLYGLSKKLGISQQELIRLNPELKEGVREGMMLTLPANTIWSTKTLNDLTQTISTEKRKKLAFLLPFNVSRIQSDTTNSVYSRLKTDKFLNMTLDFYSGVLMAIDSAKVLGLNVDISIYDSQETKNSSNVASIIKQNNFKATDLVIGPFYQTNVEKTAQLLSKDSISVMSPLSKETGKLYANLIQTMPSEEDIKDAMFAFMKSQDANIIGVIDPKKLSTRKYISENHPGLKMASFNGSGNVSTESIKSLLSTTRKNFVVMDTENTYMIKLIVGALIASLPNHSIQLVILEDNEKLDSDEIRTENLAKLKLMYPSLAKENNDLGASVFEKKYKQANNVFPNQYATRGFDVAFDALVRLSQPKSFEETLLVDITEQVENRFNYFREKDKGFKNNGFYILYYDTDLSVQIAQ